MRLGELIRQKRLIITKGKWNIEEMAHRGRHATEYHQYMLKRLESIDEVANGNTDVFLKLFEGVKQTIANNPDALYKSFWLLGGILP